MNALVACRLEQQRRTRLKLQIEHSRQALTLARERYSDGVGDFLTLLDAERTLLQAEQQYALLAFGGMTHCCRRWGWRMFF